MPAAHIAAESGIDACDPRRFVGLLHRIAELDRFTLHVGEKAVASGLDKPRQRTVRQQRKPLVIEHACDAARIALVAELTPRRVELVRLAGECRDDLLVELFGIDPLPVAV